MSRTDWNYANLTKAAKLAGGPEAFVNILVHSRDSEIASAYDSGRESMIPIIFGVGTIGTLTGIGIAKFIPMAKTWITNLNGPLIIDKPIESVEELDEIE